MKHRSHACDQERRDWPEMAGHTINTFCALIVCCMFIVWVILAYFLLDKCRRKMMCRRRKLIYETLNINMG